MISKDLCSHFSTKQSVKRMDIVLSKRVVVSGIQRKCLIIQVELRARHKRKIISRQIFLVFVAEIPCVVNKRWVIQETRSLLNLTLSIAFASNFVEIKTNSIIRHKFMEIVETIGEDVLTRWSKPIQKHCLAKVFSLLRKFTSFDVWVSS